MDENSFTVIVVGGGPAGLRVAEILSEKGVSVALLDQKASVGRKFLVAGRGGLNITHSEDEKRFASRYSPQSMGWEKILQLFSPQDLRKWVESFDIETYVGTSRRVYPRGDSAAPLLRRWVSRLKKQGVHFFMRHQLSGFRSFSGGWELSVEHEGTKKVFLTQSLVLALGGGSWPQTGSDAQWIPLFRKQGIQVHDFQPANCGWSVNWGDWFLKKYEGAPLKNIDAWTLGSEKIRGEIVVTGYGVEGTPVYTLTPFLRSQASPTVWIDLKPDLTVEQLRQKFKSRKGFIKDLEKSWNLSPIAKAFLLRGDVERTLEVCLKRVKNCPLELSGPRELQESISSAGGVCSQEVNGDGMLKKLPGVYCVGEMMDWEAPTGGYLLQACFSQAAVTAQSVLSKF